LKRPIHGKLLGKKRPETWLRLTAIDTRRLPGFAFQSGFSDGPGRIRTCDRRIMSPLL
jgi:hypothetical protein